MNFVRFVDYLPDDPEQLAVDSWATANDCTDVVDIAITAVAVSIDAFNSQGEIKTGSAIRHGDLSTELSRALENLRYLLA